MVVDSGNGYHLLYRIDLPNDEESAALLRSCLEALAARFDTPAVKIDKSVYNASRIIKAYGSLAAKGDNTAERPHRTARVLSIGDGQLVPKDKLQALARQAPTQLALTKPLVIPTQQAEGAGLITPERVEAFLQFYDVAHQPRAGMNGGYRWVLDGCILNPEHKGAAVLLRSGGRLGYHCFHNSCSEKHWREFREELERRRGGEKFRFVDGNGNSGISLEGLPDAVDPATVAEAKETPFEPFGRLGEGQLHEFFRAS